MSRFSKCSLRHHGPTGTFEVLFEPDKHPNNFSEVDKHFVPGHFPGNEVKRLIISLKINV